MPYPCNMATLITPSLRFSKTSYASSINAFADYPTGMDFVYMENTKYDPGNAKMGITYTVLRSGKKYELYGIQLDDLHHPLHPDTR